MNQKRDAQGISGHACVELNYILAQVTCKDL